MQLEEFLTMIYPWEFSSIQRNGVQGYIVTLTKAAEENSSGYLYDIINAWGGTLHEAYVQALSKIQNNGKISVRAQHRAQNKATGNISELLKELGL